MSQIPHQIIFSRTYWLKIVGLALVSLVLAGCSMMTGPTPVPTIKPEIVLQVSGAGSVGLVLEAIASDFQADTPGYRLNVLAGSDTGGGVKGIIGGLLDAAAMGRSPKAEETAKNVKYVQYGQGGVAVFTHSGVGVTSLTSDQIKAIFTGQITRWSQVGGPNQPIIVYARNESDTSATAMRKTILADAAYVTTAQILTSQSDMFNAIETTNYSIGYGAWPATLAQKAKVAAVKIDGLGPDNPSYPMMAPQGIGYLSNREADVKPLIDWLLSPQGKNALKKLAVVTP